MSEKALGRVICACDSCGRLLFDNADTVYYVRFRYDQYCVCERCVTVVKPVEEKDDAV